MASVTSEFGFSKQICSVFVTTSIYVQIFIKAIEDIKKQWDDEIQGTTDNNWKEYWGSKALQLQEERDQLQAKLICSENENKRLETELQQMSQMSSTVKDLQDQLDELKGKYEEAVTSCSLLKNQYDEARKQLEANKGEIASINTEENLQKTKDSLLKSSEEKWRIEVSKLEELIKQKDQELRRVTKKRRMRTAAYIDTLYLLTVTQDELQKSKCKWQKLEDKLQETIKDSEKNLKELLEGVEHFRIQQEDILMEAKKEVSEGKCEEEREVKDREEDGPSTPLKDPTQDDLVSMSIK